jgi:hypothetical protein
MGFEPVGLVRVPPDAPSCHAGPGRVAAACAGSVVGDVPVPEHYLIGGVCASCWNRSDAKQHIQAALASGLGVRMRVIDIGPAGHA